MIRNLKLKFGRSPGSLAQQIDCTPITVFVGPNNSGKSRFLQEIDHFCRNGVLRADAVIVDSISVKGFENEDEVDQAISRVRVKPNVNETIYQDHILIGPSNRVQIQSQSLKNILSNPESDIQSFGRIYLSNSTLTLNGSTRIGLLNDQPAGDLQNSPFGSLQNLFRDDSKRHEVRRIVYEAFGAYFVVDPTNLGQLRVRLSSRPPKDDLEERGIHQAAVEFHAAALHMQEASDGAKAFSGIISEITAGEPQIILIDEPEAFLHPALATKLGSEIARAAFRQDKRVFVSTHSPSFLMGCIQSSAPINIVRLTYRSNVATARVLPSEELLELMRHPLLRSTGVITGLFYEFIVVTESDSDRVFYQEVNERLLQFKPEWGIPNCLFINAQNKQTIQTIIRPLRKLGIPAAAVLDIDALKEGGSVWTGLLQSASIPDPLHSGLANHRGAIKTALEATGKDMKKDGGLSILASAEKEAAESLLEQLRIYGVFLVPGGEVESWLSHLAATGHGSNWLIDIFTRMGENASDESYVKPQNDDVWLFIKLIKDWFSNPNRHGIPA